MLGVRKIFKNPLFKLGFLIIFLILFFGYVRQAFFVQASDERVSIYPQEVFEENNISALKDFSLADEFLWQGGEKVFIAEADPLADFSAFNKDTSAALSFGQGQLEIDSKVNIASSSNVVENGELNTASSSEVIENNDSVESSDSSTSSDTVIQGDSSGQTSPATENSSESDSSVETVPETPAVVDIINDNGEQIVPAEINQLPSSEPAQSESIEANGPASSAEESPVSLPATDSNESAPVSLPVADSNESAPASDVGSSDAPVSFLENLKIAQKGISFFWKEITATPKALAEENVIIASSTADDSEALASEINKNEFRDSLVFSNFSLNSYSSNSEIINVQLRLSMAAVSNFDFDHLQIEYSTGKDWQEAGNFFLKGDVSNNSNGGYFLYALPLSLSWEDIDNLQVRINYLNGEIGENDLKNKNAKVYLDGIWLEVDYSKGKVKGEKELNENVRDEEIVPGGEKRFFSEEPLFVDGKEISLDYTDETSNENLIIKSDKKDYTGLTQTDVYLSVTNQGEKEENFGLQSYFPADSGNLMTLEKLSRKYVFKDESIFGTKVYFCAEGWKKSASSSEEYSCAGKEATKQCDSFSRDQKKCRQEKAIIGIAPSVGAVDEWQSANVQAGRLADKRNFLEKLFSAGPKRKDVPEKFIASESTVAEGYLIKPGETQYFKMKINFNPGSIGEFYVETIGDKTGYGLLDPWWNASWDYERPINITYAGAATLSNFQVSATIDTAALIAAGKMKSDCSDIRFADSNKYSAASELSYFLEPNTCNKTYTKVWVKIPVISGNKTIFMYYGNSSASSVSSGANTFVYFNDFESAVGFDAGLLTPSRTGKSAKSGSFGLNGNAYSSLYLASRNGISSGRNLIWESWIKGESSSTVSSLAGVVVGHPNGNNNNGYQAIIDTRGGANHYLSIRKDYSASQILAYSDTVAVANDSWYFMQLSWRSTNVIWASLYAGATTTSPLLTCSTTDSSYTDGEYGVAAYQIGDWDNYRIRKYASSTVSSSNGSETAIVNHSPVDPSLMAQYRQSTSSAISLGDWTNQRTVNFYATSTDKDSNLTNIYYQLATTSGSFLVATSAPSNVCQSTVSYASCPSRIWQNTPFTNWYNTSYKYRIPVTVLAANIAGSLTNFPVYLNLSSLGASNTFWSHTKKNSDGGDLVMTASDGTTRIPIEIVSISTSTKTGEVYFRASAISSSSNIAFYLYYGSSTAAQPASTTASIGSQQVWSNGYVGVWHYQENMAGTGNGIVYKDSVANHDGTDNIAATGKTGILGSGQQFNGTSDYILIPSFTFGGAVTVSGWVNYSAFNNWSRLIDFGSGGPNNNIFVANNGATQNLRFGIANGATEIDLDVTNFWQATGNWQYFAGTVAANGNMTAYLNGASMGSNANTTVVPSASRTNQYVGRSNWAGDAYFSGYQDELRISNTNRSTKWILTEYNNQISPSTFFSTSTEQEFAAFIKRVNITSVPDGNYKWQAIACDSFGLCSSWAAFNASLPNFKVDATAPVFSNTLSNIASTTSSIKLGFPTAVTEANFSQYKIYYRLGSSTAPNESDTLLSSSTNVNLGVQNFNGKSSTTISNLTTSTWYSFVIFAYDQAGNKASSSYVSKRTDRVPNVSFNSAAQKRDGTGAINFSIIANDADGETQMNARAEYFLDLNCRGASTKATLDETDANTTATQGDPKVQNKNTYQIGTSTGWILTTAGPNTVNFNWLSKVDFGIATGTVCFKVNLSDGRGGYKIATTSVYIDNVSPTLPGSLTFSKKTGASVTLFFGSSARDNTFREYKIFYKIGASGVHETDSVFSSSSDINLGSIVYGGAATTTITGLAPDAQYVFNIWAYDLSGNKASATTEVIVMTKSVPAIASGLGQYFSDGVTAIGNNTWTDKTEFNLYATSSSISGNPITIYYNFDVSGNSYITSTSTPANACSSGTNYANCSSRVWYASKANKANIKNIPDGYYKWRALACDADGCARDWKEFNAVVPNIKIDLTSPVIPGNLTYNSKGATSVKLNFGTQSSDLNFDEYKIYYKQGTSGIKETNSLWASSSDAALGFVNFNGKSSTTITGLTNGLNYVFNIYAYDIFGHRSSSSVETIVNLGNGPTVPFDLAQYKFGMNPLANGSWLSSSTVILKATSTEDLQFLTYYELIGNGSTFTSATTTPLNACAVGTSFNSCGSKIWVNGTSTSNWYDSDFPYRTKVIVLASRVAGALTNFPVYLNLGRLGATHSFWSHTKKNSDGGDLVMTASDGTTRVPVEVVTMSTSTKTGEAYFRAASISSSSNITFYLYYGSSTAAQPGAATTYGSQNVWSNSYVSVYHLNGNANDSKGANNGTVTNAVSSATAKVGGYSYYFDGDGDYITLANEGNFDFTGAMAVETWLNSSGYTDAWQGIIAKGDSAWRLARSNATNFPDFARSGGGNASGITISTNNTGWHYVAGSFDGTFTRIFTDASNEASTNNTGLTTTNNLAVTIGRNSDYAPARDWYGYIDEVRISNADRSGKWISTTYNNLNSPATFFSTTTEQLYPSPLQKNVRISSMPDSATGYKWQALSCDFYGCSRNWTQYLTPPNFKVDTVAPVFSNTVSFLASTTVSLKLQYPTAATEANFSQYKIFYQVGSTTPIHENATWSISSSTSGYSYLGALNFSGKSSTTITGLATGTVYSFSVWAYDQAGNKASTSLVWERTDRAPSTVIFNSAAQRTNGTGRFDISFNVNDLDRDVQLMARLDYTAGTVCNYGALSKATLDETDSNAEATYGDPKVQNKNAYQIGTSTGWIITSSGVNTVNVDWLSKSDLPAVDGVYCLRLTVNDNKGGTKIATTSIYIDNVAPTLPGSLTLDSFSGDSLVANFGAATTETNFRQYKIFYKAGASGVHETDMMFGSSSDSALASITYLSHGSTTISGLNGSTQYVFNIWAYDIYGNKASATVEMVATTKNIPAIASGLGQYLSDGTTAISNDTWISQNEINLYATSTDPDGNAITIYYQLATSTGAYITSTSTPVNACASGVTYSNCPGRVWYSSKLVKADLKTIPDGLYKWQALACTVNGCARSWKQFNATVPNVKIDATAPTLPGPLTFNNKGATTATLNFGSPSVDVRFDEYKIYYKQGTSGVKETDSLWSSSSASYLGFINYNGKSSTTITGLTNGVSYVFNIFAYDGFGRRSSSSVEVVVNLGNGPAVAYDLQQYRSNYDPILNGTWTNDRTVLLTATSSDVNPFFLFYELIANSSSFRTSTTTLPANACSNNTSFGSCSSKVWYYNWWNTNWGYREKINFGTSHSLLPVGYTASVAMDTRTANTHVALSSGNDVRIVWQSSTTMPIEIDRIGSAWNSAGTSIEFKLQSDVTANLNESKAGSYYIYYGNASAGSPLATSSGVYYEYDSFNNSSLGAQWTTIDKASAAGTTFTETSTLKISNAGTDVWTTPNDYYAGIYRTVPGDFEATVRVISQGNSNAWAKAGIMVKNNMSVTEVNSGYGVIAVTPANNYSEQWDSDGDGYLDTNAQGGTMAYPSCVRLVKAGTTFTAYYSTNCSSYTALSSFSPTSVNASQHVGLFNSSHDAAVLNASYFNWIKIRRLVATAGSVSLSAEEVFVPGDIINIPSIPDGDYKWQVVGYDIAGCSKSWKQFDLAQPNFRIDMTAPTPPGQLVLAGRNTNSITMGFGAPTTETNFKQYKIFYKQGTSAIKETDTLYGSSSDSNLNYINYNNETSFTIGGLNPNTQYSFSVWAYDQAGNKGSSTLVTFQTSNALTQTYYYANGASNGWINPAFAWDNTDDTYAYRSVPGNSVNDSANYLQGTANNAGVLGLSILGVELGLEGYSLDPSRINYKIIPIFNGLTSGATTTILGSLFGRIDGDNSFYTDITNDSQAPATWTWNDVMNLDAKLYASNASTSAATAYVDQIRLRVAVDAYPENASILKQYQSDKITEISNDSWLKQTSLVLKAEALDPDLSESLSLYFQFTTTSASFISSTTRPSNACVSGTSYTGCNSKVWVAAYSGSPDNFSITPFIGTSSITGIPDGNYKWQVLACDMSSICSNWVGFNASVPNVHIDNTVPTIPGDLSFTSKTSGSVTVSFGSQTSETNFYRYRIFYRKSSTTPVTESDSEQSDTNLGYINYNGAATTTIAGLAKTSWYTFDIWAYDLAGNKASATVPLIVKTNAGYLLGQTSYLIENDDGAGVNLNTAPGLAGVPLNNVEKGQRLNARIQIQNTGADQTYNKRFKIQYENNTDAAGVWTDVGLNTPISYSYGLSGANGDAITAVKAAANSNTWANGTWHENVNLTNMYSLAVNNYTEFAFAVQTKNATAGKTYRLRLIDGTGSSTFDTYSVYPTVSIVANDMKAYSKVSNSSLPSNSSDLAYFLDNPGYSALSADDSTRDSIVSSAGQYPIYSFAVKYGNVGYNWNVSWNGQSSVAPSSNNVILQVFRFGSTNAWTTLSTNNSAAANTDLSLTGLVDYHIAEYVSGGYSYWRAYQAPGAEILRSDYFIFSTTTLSAYVTGKHYRWRNDDAPYGTWRETIDTPDPTLGTVLQKNTNVRLRLSFSNTKAGNASNYAFGLQYATTTTNCSSGSFGSWTPVRSTATSTLHFQMASSAQFNNSSSTSSQLSSDGYTYISGSMIEGPYSTSSAVTLLEDRYTEMEFNFKATANARDGQTYCFRGTNNSVALDAYDRYAELSVGTVSNTAPAFASLPSDSGSATSTPTAYGQNVVFKATSTDAESDEYYLAVCRTNSIVAGNGGAPTCAGGSWCVSTLASSSAGATCSYNTAHQSFESGVWYAFACDLHYGAGIAQCSAMSQGTVASPNASPFRINHPPAYTAINTLNDYQDPGALFNIQATVSDSDANNTLNYYVCSTNSASSTGCNGGSANTVCSATATSSANPICHYQNVAPSPSGAFTYYAFVYDNFGLAATTSPRNNTYHINNVTPAIGAAYLNGGSDITLNIKGAIDKQVQLVANSVVDQNGCSSLVSATGVIYRTSTGYNCAANDNSCYQVTTANCVKSDCSGASDSIATYTCTADLKFFAEPTDNSTNNPWSADNWSGRLQVYDGSNYTATSAPAVEVKTTSALEVPEAVINFGSVNPGDDTGTVNQSTTIVNYGNSPLNSDLAGSDMTGNIGGTIAATYIHWDLSQSFLYSAGNTLKNGGEIVTLNLAKPINITDVTGLIYWGIGVPATSTRASFKGTNTFSAVLDGGSW